MANPDQDAEEVAANEVVPMPNREVFKPGDVVVAHCGDGSLRPAVVRSVSPKQCQVEWHAKKPHIAVPIGQLTFAEWLLLATSGGARSASSPQERKSADPPAPAEAAASFGPGVAVAVRVGKKDFYTGRIAQATKDGFAVQYPTGDTAKVKTKNLVPVPNRHVFRKGDEVIAVWSASVMHRGKIAAITPVGYTVTWDDGFGPQIVPLESLTFAAWASS